MKLNINGNGNADSPISLSSLTETAAVKTENSKVTTKQYCNILAAEQNTVSLDNRKTKKVPQNIDDFYNQLENITQTKTNNFNKKLEPINKANNKSNIAISSIMGIGSLLFSLSVSTLGVYLIASLAFAFAIGSAIGITAALLFFTTGAILLKLAYSSLDKKIQDANSKHGISALLADIFYLHNKSEQKEIKQKFDIQNLDYAQILEKIEQTLENPQIIKTIKELQNECLLGLNTTNNSKITRVENIKKRLIYLTENTFRLLFDNLKQDLTDKEKDFIDFIMMKSLKSYSDNEKTQNMLEIILSLNKIENTSSIVARINFSTMKNYNFVVNCITDGINNYVCSNDSSSKQALLN